LSKVAISGAATGTATFTIESPATNTNRTLTLPDNTGTIITSGSTGGVSQAMLASNVGGVGPAFSATIGTNQSLSAGTETKLNFNTEQFDTNSNYDTSTYRFTPTVTGYYQINAAQEYSNATGIQVITIKKNGVRVSSAGSRNATPAGTFFSCCSVIVYLNGSTDYVEAYGYTDAATTAFSGSSSTFTGCLVRAA
jgi:hypothetical protein